MSRSASGISYSSATYGFEISSLIELLHHRATSRPDRHAYVFLTDGETSEVSLTYGELERRARSVAAWLQSSGASGERVLLLYPPGLDFVAAFFGCLYAGAVAVPVYPPRMNQSLARLQSIVGDAEPSGLLTTSSSLLRSAALFGEASPLKNLWRVATDTLSDELGAIWQEPSVGGETLAFLQYTSGSTSEPKGVMVSHANLLHNMGMMARACEHTEDSSFVSWLPLYHDMGLIGNVLQSLYFGATCVLMPPPAFLQRPLRWLQAISRYKAHTSGGPDFAYEMCVRRVTAEDRATLDLSSWEAAFNGSEPIRRETIERFAATFAPCGFRREAFFPCYGLAEATLFVSGGPKESAPVTRSLLSSELKQNRLVFTTDDGDDVQVLVGCGQTLGEQKVVVTNPETLVPCAAEEVGEIWLSGPSVARGYWNKPEETTRYFHAHHADTGDGPYLRTGDLGFIKDGELFITGRLKDLIIVRGLNHYPQDIELTVQESHPALRPASGAAFSVEAGGEERVVVVQEVIPRHKGLDLRAIIETIREAVALKHELQIYSVVLIAAGSIPKTSSGKIRRRACRAMFLEGTLDVLDADRLDTDSAADTDFTVSPEEVAAAPHAERRELLEAYLENYVRRLFRAGRSQPSRTQPLSNLGLDSLTAFELSAGVSENFGVEVPPAELLGGLSIASLADRILSAQASAGDDARDTSARRIERARRDAPLPLSSTQQGLWFLDQLVKGSPFYNIPVAIRMKGALDERALEQSLDAVENRQESLRTGFVTVAGKPVQVVAPPRGLPLERIALDDLDEREREAELLRLTGELARRPFDLSEGQLVRASLLRLAADDHVLLVVVHHIIADGWSVGVLVRELTELYDASAQGRPASLAEPPIQYADYAVWQQQLLESDELRNQLAYWKRQLGGSLPVLELPSDYARPAASSHCGATQRFEVGPEVTSRLKALGRQEGATLFMVLTATLNVLVHRYTGQQDIILGTPVANRRRREFEPLVGCFVNTLALRTAVTGEETFRDFLHTTRRVMLEAYAHQDVPFEKLVEELQPERGLSHSPLFQVMIASQNAPRWATQMGGLSLSRFEVDTGTAKFDLLAFVDEDERGLSCSFEYKTELFEPERVARMARHFQTLLSGIASDPDRSVSTLPLLPDDERRQLLFDWNSTDTRAHSSSNAYSGAASQPMHKLFEVQAAATPDALALRCGERDVTYGGLNRLANGVARRLREEGVGPESVVGVCADRDVSMVAAMLGVMKAGGAYLPLDPAYPRERLAFMLEDSRASVLLTGQASGENLPPTSARVLRLEGDLGAEAPDEGEDNLAVDVADNNLAYVIYTSGSTGRPKGVAIEHRSATALLRWGKAVFTPEELSGVLASTSICFDLSVFEIFLPLSWGGTIILAENALQLPELPRAPEVKLINTVPSAMGQLLAMRAVPSSVVTVNLAGEPMSGALARQLFDETATRKLFNLYGPTEDTTYSTFALIDARAVENPSIGRPIDGTRAYILDRKLQPAPAGVAGELYLAGEGLARGYLNRPEATAEKFIPDPFADSPGQRLYKTGDLARYLPDGRIDFLGRLDHQVKVRGFRIELGEVESALLRHPALSDVLVKDYGEGAGKRLVAYIVGRGGDVPSPPELRKFLAEHLPDFMIPSAFVVLERMPLTPNGKVDRKALPPPEQTSRDAGGEFVAPRNETESLLASLWEDLLGLERVGIHDNFFDSGGHSLLAAQLVSRLRQTLEIELPLRALFSSPTVAGLAEEIEALRRERQGQKLPPIRRGERGERPPLSFAQQRLWLLDQLEPGNPFYNISGGVRLGGALDVEAMRRSVNEIVSRHEALRTGFASADGEPYQVVAPEISLTLPVLDLSHLDEQEREYRLARHIRLDARAAFDLKEPPLLRVSLVRLAEREHVLLLTAHHIIFDGRSIEVFVKELGALYESFGGGRRALGELPVQCADYACWQRRWMAGGEPLDSQLAYWKSQLGGSLPVLELPADRMRPPVQTFSGAKYPLTLGRELTGALRALGNRHGATLFMTLLAAFKILLYRYTGQRDVVVGSPVSNRNRLEIENLIGFFVNTLALRTDLSGRQSFEELLRLVRETALEAYAHQDVPFEKLVEELQPERGLSHSPLFQVVFSLRRSAASALELPGLSLSQFEVDTGSAKFDLALQLEETADGLTGYFEYRTELFERQRVARMARHFRTLLSSIISDPGRNVSTLPILPDDERRLLLVDWNQTDTPPSSYARPLAHEQFEAQAAARPVAEALRCGSRSVSYGELNRMADRVARRLREEGVGPEKVVGVCAARGVSMVAAMLGVMKAGGAYLPLDPQYPAERLAFMLEDSRASVLLSERKAVQALDDYSGKTLFIEELDDGLSLVSDGHAEDSEDSENRVAVGPENLAYVIYTSGSTGRPKGVMVRHAGLSNLVGWHRRVYEPSPADRVTHLAGLEFDASVWELWPHLAAGASIHIPDEETRLSPPKLVEWLAAEAITICFLPTPLAEAVLQGTWPRDASLRLLLVGGDRLQRRPAEPLPFKVVNHYGPTENTVVATASPVENDSRAATLPDIGRPISNVRVYLLDAHLALVPLGVNGELCIAGDGLARGYFNRPDLTAERFVPDPFSRETGARLYRTGDLARYLPDGRIEFVGRADAQVKLRGFRIELSEIEAVLSEHEDVREAVALIREDAPGEKRLIAYVVNTPGRTPADGTLREHLKQKLPDYMIPSAIVMLDELPLTPNGKVDRRALPAPSRTDAARSRHAAGNVAEAALAAIWAEVLDIEQPGVDENFFEIGGHSLRAAQVMSRVRDAFGVNLPLRSLFEAPTVAGLSKAIERARGGGAGVRDALPLPAAREAEPPLSFAQERLWFLSRLHPESPAYNISGVVRISGPVSPQVIEQSINEIVRRHESLRTTFQTVRGRPVQVIAPQLNLSLPTVDLSRLSEDAREEELRRLALAEARKPFDLTTGPLLRAALVQLGGTEQALLLTIHHIVSDGWSVRVFAGELGALLESFAAGRPSPLADLPVQYGDFASWQRQRLEGEALQQELDFWKRHLAGAPAALDFPTDHPRPHVLTLRGARYSFEFSETLSDEVRRWSRRQGVTMFMAFHAALQVLLRHNTSADDIIVGADIAERNSTELENLIGLFVNQLVLRVDAAGARTFGELLRLVREVALAAYDHQHVPFDKIVEAVKPDIDLGRNPLFQVMLVFESEPIFSLRLEGLSMTLEETDAGGTAFDFSLVISDASGPIKGALRYSTDLFESATMERLAEQLETILRAVVARPDIELSELREVLARADEERLRALAQELKEISSRKFGRLRPRTAETVGGD